MFKSTVSRRKALKFLGLSAGAAIVQKADGHNPELKPRPGPDFKFSLNMATIRGHNLGFIKELQTASEAGFRSVEIWMDTLQAHLGKGGTIKEAGKIINDLGIKIENCISFSKWIVDDDGVRGKGIEQMKMEMGLVAELGCRRIAATGEGVMNDPGINFSAAAGRYRTILELGDTTGVVPQLEMWGFMKNISKVSEVVYIALESGHPSAKILLDIFHLYRGNTPIDTLPLMSPAAVDILHMNDYPASPPYQTITDADRVYPGDGIAPLKRILKILKRNDQPLVLSAELFNQAYYRQNALTVAKTALFKMKAVADSV